MVCYLPFYQYGFVTWQYLQMGVCLPATLAVRKNQGGRWSKHYQMQEAEPILPGLEQVACLQAML